MQRVAAGEKSFGWIKQHVIVDKPRAEPFRQQAADSQLPSAWPAVDMNYTAGRLLRHAASFDKFTPPASVSRNASPQALASVRTRRM